MYAAAALATAVTTLASLAFTPASGVSAPPAEPASPYIVTAHSRADARALVGEVRWRVRRYYTAALPGFATLLTAREAAELRADPRVRSLEPDLLLHPTTARLPRLPLSTTVYVVGSGVTPGVHDQVWAGFDATGGTGVNCSDVADLIPDRPRVVSVRVIGCGGTATLTDLLAGLDWVRRHARRPAVAIIPFSGVSPALDIAARRLAHLAPQPPALASWPKSTTARGAIRQNPSGTPVQSGGS